MDQLTEMERELTFLRAEAAWLQDQLAKLVKKNEEEEMFQKASEIDQFSKLNREVAHMRAKTRRLQDQIAVLNEENEMKNFIRQIYQDGKPLSEFRRNDLRRLLRYVEGKMEMQRQAAQMSPPNSSPTPNEVQDGIDSGVKVDEQVSE
ncbi:uncharacterized protein LOC133302698 [Gastrolobium bilobum]|uniref:uncharacterized protein LOC133302698 n=1 Tax=Gastrolobium bilobum TaxID=150636 RepID=UPI002AB0D2E3|nr:uncharacterized protein LOC133302698 [Gastrolobium bilobum]XP_061358492.1 uncharacterized protein LOC133302698 [Gastrolobium bilobum]